MPPPASESRTQFHHHHHLHHHHLIICQRVKHRHHSPTSFLPILSVRTWDKCGNLPLSSLQIISLQLGFSSRLLWDLSVSQNAPRRKLIDALSTIKEKTFSYQKKKTLSYLCCCCSFSSLCRDPVAAVQERSPFTLLALHTLLYTLTRISSMRCFIMHLVLNIAGQCFFYERKIWNQLTVRYCSVYSALPPHAKKKSFS